MQRPPRPRRHGHQGLAFETPAIDNLEDADALDQITQPRKLVPKLSQVVVTQRK
jgi:hypothetical protein